MPKLPDFTIRAQARDGTEYFKQVSCSVLADGTFSISCPDELQGILKCKDRFYGKNLAEAKREMNHAAKVHIECETRDEVVIAYSLKTRVAVAIGKDGKFYPNGSIAVEETGSYALNKSMQESPTTGDGEKLYSVGLGARVVTLRSFIRQTGTNHVIERFDPDDKNSYAARLNAFTHVYLDESAKRIPYTEEAAKFFYEIQIGICDLAIRLEKYLLNNEMLTKAIASGFTKKLLS